MKVMILGGDGMLGHQLVRMLSPLFEVRTTIRSEKPLPGTEHLFTRKNTFFGVDVLSQKTLEEALNKFVPEVVINAVGIVKQRQEAIESIPCIAVNALFPHRLQKITDNLGIRIIHLSTDCIFSGKDGNYTESDPPDAEDLYGRSKLLGELMTDNAVTLRTSIIGHELKNFHGLVEWFLSQKTAIRGYTKAVFSGFPTCEVSKVLYQHVIPDRSLRGIYHISSAPISKYDLLKLVAKRYGKTIDIKSDDTLQIDRTLDSSAFRILTGYTPPSWPELIDQMYQNYNSVTYYRPH